MLGPVDWAQETPPFLGPFPAHRIRDVHTWKNIGSLEVVNLETSGVALKPMQRSASVEKPIRFGLPKKKRRQARSVEELFPRAAIITDFATCHPSKSMVAFCKPMNWIQNLVRSTGGFHRRRSCAFGPSRHKLPRSIRSCEPPQPSGEFQGSCE